MSDKKYINKQYLLQTLRNFDKDVLSKKYSNNSASKGDPGENGITPHIGENGNWFIGENDTNVKASGKDGKSISQITLDDNNNLTVTFSDGSTQNIGSLSVNVEADFLTSTGFGNLRYYQGKLEYYNGENWIETSITPDNIYIINMMPQAMKHMCGIYDVEKGHYKLMFEEPDDTVIDGQVACVVEKVIIRRKLNTEPLDENDGALAITITRSDFGIYKNEWYVDKEFSPTMGETWYYKAFPVSTTGFVNKDGKNSTGAIKVKNYYLFGFDISQTEVNPDKIVSYTQDNKNFFNAFMDYDADEFNYGSWKNAFFMPRPCMLNFDGTVAYYLNPDDYTLKEDGTPSDVSDASCEMNAMMEFPKIWWRNTTNGYFISDKKVDDQFRCWSNIDENGDEIPHFYMPIYEGCLVDGRIRSLSGQNILDNHKVQDFLNYADIYNSDTLHMYDIHVFCDIQLFRLLCVLISKTTNSQKAFGKGCVAGSSELKPGTLNKKGMFHGSQNISQGVKIFGCENMYGNCFQTCAGWVRISGTQKFKMTYGTSDGSTKKGYSVDGTGYFSISGINNSSNGFIGKCNTDKHGLIPSASGGSATTGFCDYLGFYDRSSVAVLGGYFGSSEDHAGIFFSYLYYRTDVGISDVGSSISCKPTLAIQTGGNS